MPASHIVERPAELLAFLLACHPDVAKSRVQRWLKYGMVQVNGQSLTRFNHPLLTGDLVSIRDQADVRAQSQLPAGMKILFQDASLIVIEKPENLLSMASDSEREKTAQAYLTNYLRRGQRQRPERVWIVHRLDCETSGLMVFAKTEAAKVVLQSHWTRAEKRYLAVVEGAPPESSGVLKSHLDESSPFKVYSAPHSDQTRQAVTHYRVIRKGSDLALVELTLETGRRNQIRVHLSDIGCPIIGDSKYDARTNLARRLGLHASYLQFEHPSSGEVLHFESPLPDALARLL
ncbi:MAG: RluA family pseudouridine synthase [Planctomycetota bacterium]|nr:RluA family pseudouridine synthase [Planctomycetota bacterium]MDA1162282.1 RluA family pseudouridine synthase [Planctomycetota bacterium]